MVDKITLKCTKCGRVIHTNKEGLESRQRLFADQKDFDKNFKCKFCKVEVKLKNA